MRFVGHVDARTALSGWALAAAAALGACSSSVQGQPAPQDASSPIVEAAAPPVTEASAPTDSAPPPPPSAGGTGAFGIVTVGGKQKMYLPQQQLLVDADSGSSQGSYYISVLDVGVAGVSAGADAGAGAPALITNILLPDPIDGGISDSYFGTYATATGGDSSMVVAVSSVCPAVWFIDPTSDTVVGSLVLDSTYGQASFSGGSAYVSGVAVDSTHNRAILSVWNGYVLVDLTTFAITATISAPPAENFGYDSVLQRIYSPFYGCTQSSNAAGMTPASCDNPKGPDGMTVMTDGLEVIDLSNPSYPVYTYENSELDDAGLISDPNYPVGYEPDSAAVDPTTGTVVIPSEGSSFQSVIDMSTATFDATAGTVTAPRALMNSDQVSDLDAVAIEPNSHMALWEVEFGSQVAAANLTPGTGTIAWAYGTMPSLPDGGDFSNIGDPHGLAVTTASVGGKPIGFVVDQGLRWVARIDFSQIAQLAAGNASVDLDLSAPDGGSGGIAAYVTYLDAQTPE